MSPATAASVSSSDVHVNLPRRCTQSRGMLHEWCCTPWGCVGVSCAAHVVPCLSRCSFALLPCQDAAAPSLGVSTYTQSARTAMDRFSGGSVALTAGPMHLRAQGLASADRSGWVMPALGGDCTHLWVNEWAAGFGLLRGLGQVGVRLGRQGWGTHRMTCAVVMAPCHEHPNPAPSTISVTIALLRPCLCSPAPWQHRFFAERVEGAKERQQAFAMRTRNAKYSAVHLFRAYRKGVCRATQPLPTIRVSSRLCVFSVHAIPCRPPVVYLLCNRRGARHPNQAEGLAGSLAGIALWRVHVVPIPWVMMGSLLPAGSAPHAPPILGNHVE
jgi:hypothetical protein